MRRILELSSIERKLFRKNCSFFSYYTPHELTTTLHSMWLTFLLSLLKWKADVTATLNNPLMLTSLKERKFEKKKAKMLNLNTAKKMIEKREKAETKRKREQFRFVFVILFPLNFLAHVF